MPGERNAGCRAEPWPAPLATAGDDLIDVVAGLGFIGQPLDQIVVDGLVRPGVSVGALGHGLSSFR